MTFAEFTENNPEYCMNQARRVAGLLFGSLDKYSEEEQEAKIQKAKALMYVFVDTMIKYQDVQFEVPDTPSTEEDMQIKLY